MHAAWLTLHTVGRVGKFTLYRENDRAPVTGETEMRELLASALNKVLLNLARQALFFAEKP